MELTFAFFCAAIKEIFHQPTTAFWTGKVMDLLFNGFDVDCKSEDFNAKTVCSVFDAGEVEAVSHKEGVEDMYQFSLFKAVIFNKFRKRVTY